MLPLSLAAVTAAQRLLLREQQLKVISPEAAAGADDGWAKGLDSMGNVFKKYVEEVEGLRWPLPLTNPLCIRYIRYVGLERKLSASYITKLPTFFSRLGDPEGPLGYDRSDRQFRELKRHVADMVRIAPKGYRQREAIPDVIVNGPRMVQLALEEDEAEGIAFAARFMLMLNCGFRGGETAPLKLQLKHVFITHESGKVTAVRLHVHDSKTNKTTGVPQVKYINARTDKLDGIKPFVRFMQAEHGYRCPAGSGEHVPLAHQLAAASVRRAGGEPSAAAVAAMGERPLFSALKGGTGASDVSAINKRVKELAAGIGLPAETVKTLGSHSLRKSFTSLAAAAGVSGSDIAAAQFWRDPDIKPQQRLGNLKLMATYAKSDDSAYGIWQRVHAALSAYLRKAKSGV